MAWPSFFGPPIVPGPLEARQSLLPSIGVVGDSWGEALFHHFASASLPSWLCLLNLWTHLLFSGASLGAWPQQVSGSSGFVEVLGFQPYLRQRLIFGCCPGLGWLGVSCCVFPTFALLCVTDMNCSCLLCLSSHFAEIYDSFQPDLVEEKANVDLFFFFFCFLSSYHEVLCPDWFSKSRFLFIPVNTKY